jgi:multidrug resistance efflux pump
VSGIVSEVDARDNQTVHKGDIIFRIDQARFTLALRQAETQMQSSKAALDMAKSDLELYRKLGESSVTRQKIQQAETTVQQDEATYDLAVISRDTAQL